MLVTLSEIHGPLNENDDDDIINNNSDEDDIKFNEQIMVVYKI